VDVSRGYDPRFLQTSCPLTAIHSRAERVVDVPLGELEVDVDRRDCSSLLMAAERLRKLRVGRWLWTALPVLLVA
jgi:hypothetical protein